LIVEQCSGLIAAAVAERQAGYGHICCASVDTRAASIDMVRFLNQSAEQRSIISTATLLELQEAAEAVQQQQEQAQQEQAAAAGGGQEAAAGSTAASDDVAMPDAAEAQQDAAQAAPAAGPADAAAGTAAAPSSEVQAGKPGAEQQKQPRKQPQRGGPLTTATPELLQQLLQPGFTSCIIAAPKLHTSALLREVLPLLQPSASLVVYSPFLQPLAEAQAELSTARLAVQLQVQESWFREHQVGCWGAGLLPCWLPALCVHVCLLGCTPQSIMLSPPGFS
jgi:tRNA (adenine-N(1)-)-methyltransferase non-catalytic subunit